MGEEKLVAFAISQEAPIPWETFASWTLLPNAGRAVGGDRIIPARMALERVERIHVFKEVLARLRRRQREVVKIDVFALPIISGQTEHVRFLGYDRRADEE
jgi:hypothetical protein